MTKEFVPGYHIKPIEKGELGETSKIQEELDELCDAHEQQSKIMELVELSDLVGAVKLYLGKHHPGITLQDLDTMAMITERAFKNGRRV